MTDSFVKTQLVYMSSRSCLHCFLTPGRNAENMLHIIHCCFVTFETLFCNELQINVDVFNYSTA